MIKNIPTVAPHDHTRIQITKPEHGWSDIQFHENMELIFTGHMSYVQDVLSMFLEMFRVHLTQNCSTAAEFDEEGSSFTIILQNDSVRVIEDRADTKVYTFYIKDTDFISQVLDKMSFYLPEWVAFDEFDATDDYLKNKLKDAQNKIFNLRALINHTLN